MRISIVEVDGQPLKLFDSSDGNAKVGDDAPHSHYALARGDVHADASAFKTLAEKIAQVHSVVELFGGSGWHSSIIQRINKPTHHLAIEIAPDSARSIRESQAYVAVEEGDTYRLAQDLLPDVWEWVHADFNNLTFMKWRDGTSPHGKLVRQIFRVARRWVTLTDSAVFGLARFPRNRDAYATVFNKPTFTWQDYYQEVAKKVSAAYGFQCRDAVVWHRMAGMMLFERSTEARPFVVREHKGKIPVKLLSTEVVP